MKTPMLSKVLVTSDLTPASQKVFEFALQMSSPWQADITILHVFDKASPTEDRLLEMTVGKERLRSIRSSQKEAARQKLIGKRRTALRCETGQSEGASDSTIHVKMNYGTRLADNICKVAREDAFDLIVMGLHRRKGLESLVGKSTVGRVIEKAIVPVIVFPIPDE